MHFLQQLPIISPEMPLSFGKNKNMIQINEYFDGNVKSLAYNSGEGKSTVGVMEPGSYEFGTSQMEIMLVVEGEMEILLPLENNWKTIQQGESFEIAANTSFKVKVSGQVSYLCKYR